MNRYYLPFLILGFLLLSITLVGCNSNTTNEENDQDQNQDGSSNEVITLQMWGGVPAEAGPQEVVDNWNAENPNVQVEYTRFVNDDDGNLRLNTALQTGQNVDIFVGYSPALLQDRVDSGFALDLGDFEGYDIEEKMGEVVEQWKYNDTYYAVPTKQSADVVFLNKDALDEAGLEVPTDWTWDEFREYGKALKNDNQWGAITWNADLGIIIESALLTDGWLKEDGSSNFNHPLVSEGFELMYSMLHEDETIPPLGEQISTGIAPEHMFLNGEVAMFSAFEGILRMSNDLEEYPRDFVIALAPIPRFENGDMIGHILGDSLSIATNSEYPDEAWEFIKWYADEGMIALAGGGRIPSSKDADIEEAMKLLVQGVEETYDMDSLERMFTPFGKLRETKPIQVIDTLKSESEKYYLNEQDLEKTIQEVEKMHNQHLEK